MTGSLQYWKNVYEKSKDLSACIDIERAWFNGPIAVVGIYRPCEGVIECEQLIRGLNLSTENLKSALAGVKLLITFNGLSNDIPAIDEQFPDVIPKHREILDLYRFSRHFQVNASLKTWESTFGIERGGCAWGKKHRAIRLWQRYERSKDRNALAALLEYNRQDTINLYPLAEKFMEFVESEGQEAISATCPSVGTRSF